MSKPLRLLAVFLIVSISVCAAQKPCKVKPSQDPRACSEITISTDVWSYQRLFNYLNSIGQDMASTQTPQPSINPIASNATQVDALQQSFQVQAGYSQSLAMQNQVAAQMASANVTQQTSLLQQQSTLTSQLANAQSAYLQATNRLQSDQASQQPASIIAADTQAQNQAQNSITSVNALLTQVNSQVKSPAYSPTFPTGNAAGGTSTPAALSGSSLLSPNTSAVSMSATKQLDTYYGFFWERMMRVLQSLVRPDSASKDESLYLVHVSTGIFPINRKHELLEMKYTLTCKPSKTGSTGAPYVVDLYPRVAAINVTDTKYRDSQTALGAVVSLFSIGVNAAYNREHLQASQYLGQSSYITGYGVGQHSFGWKFGITLGDDQLSSDTRQTAVLVAAPKGCEPDMSRDYALWMNPKGKLGEHQEEDAKTSKTLDPWKTYTFPIATTGNAYVASIDFNRVEYDPAATSSSPPIVSLTLTLNEDIDQQTTVMANGSPIRLARETFDRAVSGSGTNGLLESASIGTNTWLPINSRTIMLFLDATAFGTQFPEILLVSPAGTKNISTEIAKNCPAITVSGQALQTTAPCTGLIPSISFQKSTTRSISVVRVLQGTPGQDMPQAPVRVMFTDLGVASSQTQTNSAATTDIRVVANSSQSIWSPLTEVYELDRSANQMARLNCINTQSTGSQLICDLPSSPGGMTPSVTSARMFQVIDVVHQIDTTGTIGSVKGWANLALCVDSATDQHPCKIPTFLSMSSPLPDQLDASWNLTVNFVNVNTLDQVEPNNVTLAGIPSLPLTTSGVEDQPFAVTFNVSPAQLSTLQNNAILKIKHDSKDIQTVLLTNLLNNLRPTASQIASTSMTWSGSNLLSSYTNMRIGTDGKDHPIQCNGDVMCQVNPTEDLTKETNSGFIYLKTVQGTLVPLMSTATGALTFATFSATKPATNPANPGTQNQANAAVQGLNVASPPLAVQNAPIVGAAGLATAQAQTTVVATQNVKINP